MPTRIPTARPSRIAIALTLFGLSGAMAAAGASAAPIDDASRLVTAMRMDFALLDAIQWRFRMGTSTSDHDVYECLLKKDDARLDPSLAERVAQRLSDDEVAAVLAFYSSPAGRKFTVGTLVQVHRQADAHVTEDMPAMSADEFDQLKAFTRTAVYPKLQQLLVPLPKDTLAVIGAMQSECEAAPLKTPS